MLTMKKILLLTLICGGMLSASAQTTDSTNTNANTNATTTTTTTSHQYYYYPSANIYWDQATGNYWYKDNTSNQWVETQTLPSTVTLDNNAEKYSLDYTGDQPYKNNAQDIKKYKVKSNGTVKIKPEKH
jgi:hypothetical protein